MHTVLQQQLDRVGLRRPVLLAALHQEAPLRFREGGKQLSKADQEHRFGSVALRCPPEPVEEAGPNLVGVDRQTVLEVEKRQHQGNSPATRRFLYGSEGDGVVLGGEQLPRPLALD